MKPDSCPAHHPAVVRDGLNVETGPDMALARACPPIRTTLWAPLMNSQRCRWSTVAPLASLAAKSKPERSL